jgi:hypothetical protein
MALACDGCGTHDNVRRAFITTWNGTIWDLCLPCAAPVAGLLDAMAYKQPAWPPLPQERSK